MPTTVSMASPIGETSTADATGLFRLPYELRAEVIKQFVWQPLPPVEGPEADTPVLDRFKKDLYSLLLVGNWEIIDHLKTAMKARQEHKEAEASRLDDLGWEFEEIFPDPEDLRDENGCGGGGQDEPCFCSHCIYGHYEEDVVWKYLESAMPDWREELGDYWFEKHLRRHADDENVDMLHFQEKAAGEMCARSSYRKAVVWMLNGPLSTIRRLEVCPI